MGIGAAVKNILSSDETTADNTAGGTRESKAGGERTSRQLPPGTGPGTSGKPAVPSELAMQSDLERSRTGQSTSGYGTDAAAAMGGTLAGTHQPSPGINRTSTRRTSASAPGTGLTSDVATGSGLRTNGDQINTGGQAVPVTYAKVGEFDPDTEGTMRGTGPTSYHDPTSQGLSAAVGRPGPIEEDHIHGHTKHSARDAMPTGKTQEDTNQLQPVYHENIRHVEVEEITHVKNRERHIHHIQHHTQPVFVSQELEERIREIRRPLTQVNETHANYPEDKSLFQEQIYENRDSVSHTEKERTIIDKGMTVIETVHHHVHHVIQPLIQKEVIEKDRIRTTIPIREVTHEAPVIHQSQKHTPVAMQHFLQRGGTLKGGVPQDDIIKKVLHAGKCDRDVQIADSVGDMNLGAKATQDTTTAPGTDLTDEGVAPQKDAQPSTSLNQSSRN